MKKSANTRASAPEARPSTVLVVASGAAGRRRVARSLARSFLARELAPSALSDLAPLVDADAALVVLSVADGEEERALFDELRKLRAGRSIILLAEEMDEAEIEKAIQRLDPVAALPFPPRSTELELALRRALGSGPRGQGAVTQQRRATALLGVSSAIRDVLSQVKRFAPTKMPILILGETGSGKELVARATHDQSSFSEGPFVAINCSALPEALLEAELFGVLAGAFTGATQDRPGLFEEANGGTLFLDEIGDTPPPLQAKLLRALETHEVRAVGATRARPVDVRIVSATHMDLEAAVKEGRFRQDLLYRLNAATVHVPALRRRRVDIPFLAQHFAEEFGDAHARRIVLEEGFVEALERYDFPGNVRELRNAVERALALANPDAPVSAADLQLDSGPATTRDTPKRGSLRERVEQLEFEAIRETLDSFKGNRTRTADSLGLSRLGLRQKMRRLGLDDGSNR